MGYLGIWISYFLIKLSVGYGAFIIPLLLAAWGVVIFVDGNRHWLFRHTGYLSLLVLLLDLGAALIASRFLHHQTAAFHYTGVFCTYTAWTIADFLGRWGALLFLLAGMAFTFQGWFSISYLKAIQTARDWLVNWVRNLKLFSRKTAPEAEEEIEETLRIETTVAIPEPVPPPEPELAVEKAETGEKEPISSIEEDSTIQIEQEVVEEEVDYDQVRDSAPKREYQLPSVDLLQEPPPPPPAQRKEVLLEKAQVLVQTLASFGVEGKVTHIAPGPIITRYEVEPGPGIRVARIAALSDDIARVMKARSVRIIAPIPGKNSVGVELPNEKPEVVYLKSIINSEKFTNADSLLTIALGKSTSGEIVVADLGRMPHLLIAGATGSGKSVCINTIIASLLYRARPDEVKFVLIDPKKLELSTYRKLQGYHLITSEGLDEQVITRPKNAVRALRAVEIEMERRYEILSEATVRNIDQYNQKAQKMGKAPLPYIVVVIDELADLMLTAAKEIEEPIARLAQMARAVGIHLVVATQRPSVDVITGVIKANFPTRIAFQVAQKNDSRTILDRNGAEKLLGRGDMLYLAPGAGNPVRLHSAFISLEEIESILEHITNQPRAEQEEKLPEPKEAEETEGDLGWGRGSRDPLFDEAMRLVILAQQGSTSMLQRRLRIGYARAGRLMDELEQAGIVGPNTGSKAREVLVGPEFLNNPSFDPDSLNED